MLLDDYLYIAHRIDRAMARRVCPRLRGEVLDVGCGTSPYRPLLTHASRYVGLDPNPGVRPDVVGSVMDLPFDAGSFDSAMCNEVLEHIPDPGQALAQIHRVLRPGGILYVTVPQAWGLHYEPEDYYRYTSYGISYLLERAGFELIEIHQLGGLFSYASVRLIDLAVARGLFPLLDRMGLGRGRYRLAALLALPFNLILAPLSSALDRVDRLNAYGWAVLARRSRHDNPLPSATQAASTALAR